MTMTISNGRYVLEEGVPRPVSMENTSGYTLEATGLNLMVCFDVTSGGSKECIRQQCWVHNKSP